MMSVVYWGMNGFGMWVLARGVLRSRALARRRLRDHVGHRGRHHAPQHAGAGRAVPPLASLRCSSTCRRGGERRGWPTSSPCAVQGAWYIGLGVLCMLITSVSMGRVIRASQTAAAESTAAEPAGAGARAVNRAEIAPWLLARWRASPARAPRRSSPSPSDGRSASSTTAAATRRSRPTPRSCGPAPTSGAAAWPPRPGAAPLGCMGRIDEAIGPYEAVPRLRTPTAARPRGASTAPPSWRPAGAISRAPCATRGARSSSTPTRSRPEDAVRLLVVRLRAAGRARELAGAARAGCRGARPGDRRRRQPPARRRTRWRRIWTIPPSAIRVWDHLAALYRARQPPRRRHVARRPDGAAAGDFHGAIKRLRVITNQRRIALFHRQLHLKERLDDALLLIGRIYRDDLQGPGPRPARLRRPPRQLRDVGAARRRPARDRPHPRRHWATAPRVPGRRGRLRQGFPTGKHSRFEGAQLRAYARGAHDQRAFDPGLARGRSAPAAARPRLTDPTPRGRRLRRRYEAVLLDLRSCRATRANAPRR
ncbi:MAG: hypothetical protein MZV49_26340 [Rhodopseudomonas palustris]|nr:hypothetical protein [Rhodopseudomonas palustris]